MEGILHDISADMRVSLANMCIEDTPEPRYADQLALSKQLTIKISKEEILFDKTVLAVSEKYIYALYYNKVSYSAECCNIAAVFERELKNLNRN